MDSFKPYLKLIILTLASLTFLVGCASSSYNTATGKRETIFYSTEKEVKLGKSLAKKIEARYKLLDDEKQQQRIQRIGQRIARVSDRQDITYHFKIIKDKEPNALSLPGGYVYLSSGIVNLAGKDDDEVAAIIAHEVGHVAAYHVVKMMQQKFLYSFLQILTLTQKTGRGFHQGSSFAYLSYTVQYTRECEKEADRLSVRYLKRAGYNPEAALIILTKLEEFGKKEPLKRYSYFKTHPSIAAREALIKEEITGKLDYKSYLNLPNEDQENLSN